MADKKLAHNFKTNVLLKNVLGKDLINDDNIAVQELVKNSYDAGAKKIDVTFENLKDNSDGKSISYEKCDEKTSRLSIRDNGKGMDITDIDWKWLNIAYSEKKALKEDMGRTLAGNKGVGRFSCDRLGEYLDLYTRKAGKSYVHLYLDWKNFEQENKKEMQIQAVEVKVKEIEARDFERETGIGPFAQGTVLVIRRLRAPWTTPPKKESGSWEIKRLLDLRKALEKLINPNVAFRNGALEMNLNAPDFLAEDDAETNVNEKINGIVRNRIFEKLDFKATSIESVISGDGKKISTELRDKGRKVFELTESNSEFALLKGIKVTVYYLSTYSKVYFHKQTGLRLVNFGSIHLFVNGFRVSPYGDLGNDWLGIDRTKQQGYADYLGTREIVGRIEIDDPQGVFKIVSSREGIVVDARYKQLVGDVENEGYFDRVFRRLNRYVVEGLNWDKTLETDKEIEKRVFAPGRKINYGEEIYLEEQDKKDRRAVGVIVSIVNPKREDFIKLWINPELVEKLQSEELERLRRILGDVERFDSGVIEGGTKKAFKTLRLVLEKQDKKLKVAQEENEELAKKYREKEKQARVLAVEGRRKDREIFFHKRLLSNDVEQVVSFQHDIGLAANTIKQNLILMKNMVLSGREIPGEKLLDFVDKISFQNNKIVSISNFITKGNFKTDSADIESDLIEFLKQYMENVCKGVVTTHDSSPMGVHFGQVRKSDTFELRFKPIEIAIIIDNLLSNSRKARATNIYVSVEKLSEKELEIRFKDDGKGVAKAIREKIFEFGFTTTSGSGMGLHHVETVLKDFNGKILLSASEGKGAEFIIRISR